MTTTCEVTIQAGTVCGIVPSARCGRCAKATCSQHLGGNGHSGWLPQVPPYGVVCEPCRSSRENARQKFIAEHLGAIIARYITVNGASRVVIVRDGNTDVAVTIPDRPSYEYVQANDGTDSLADIGTAYMVGHDFGNGATESWIVNANSAIAYAAVPEVFFPIKPEGLDQLARMSPRRRRRSKLISGPPVASKASFDPVKGSSSVGNQWEFDRFWASHSRSLIFRLLAPFNIESNSSIGAVPVYVERGSGLPRLSTWPVLRLDDPAHAMSVPICRMVESYARTLHNEPSCDTSPDSGELRFLFQDFQPNGTVQSW